MRAWSCHLALPHQLLACSRPAMTNHHLSPAGCRRQCAHHSSTPALLEGAPAPCVGARGMWVVQQTNSKHQKRVWLAVSGELDECAGAARKAQREGQHLTLAMASCRSRSVLQCSPAFPISLPPSPFSRADCIELQAPPCSHLCSAPKR